MSAGSAGAAGDRVYFFLSYAHLERHGRRADLPDKTVRDFFQDLSDEIARYAALPPGVTVGFADWEIPTGHAWRRELGHVLATCGVFLALYSPDYFERTVCGQEWAAFHRREQTHHAHAHAEKPAIVPVMWQKMDNGHMPPVARRIHYWLNSAGELYRRRGMRELVMRRNRQEVAEAYRFALKAFAEHIVTVADNDPLLPSEEGVLQLDPSDDAFAGDWSRDDPRPLRFVIVAPVLGNLPPRASPQLYGNSPEHWRPYWPADDTPIAKTAIALGQADGFHPFVEFLGSCPDLRDGEGPSAPTILIVDPWAAQDPELSELLHSFDQVSYDKPWVRLVICWDKDGSGDGNQINELERGLQRTLDRTRAQCRMANPEAVAGLAKVAAFGERLPGVIAAAEQGYFRRTRAFTPSGTGPSLPRLGGAAPGGQARDARDEGEGKSNGR